MLADGEHDGTPAELPVGSTDELDEVRVFDRLQLINVWEGYFQLSEVADRIRHEIDNGSESLLLNYWELDKCTDDDFMENLSLYPTRCILAAQAAMMNVHQSNIRIRLVGLPQSQRVPVAHIRERYIGKLIGVSGVIAQDTRVFPFMDDAYFECLRCHSIMRVRQDDIIVRLPLECSKDDPHSYVGDPGCGRSASSTSFKLLDERVKWRDYQCVMLEESPEEMDDPRRQTSHVEVRLMDDLAGNLIAGDRCIVNGILRTRPRTIKDNTVVREFILDAVGVEKVHDDANKDMTAADKERMEMIAARDDTLEVVKDMMAPDIYGMDEAKRILTLSLMGGVAKRARGNTHLRGDIHVLIVGDPSTAKSQLVVRAGSLSPRHVLASGKASSGVGLTAAVVKEEFEFGKGRPTLKAGAMPKAHRGTLIIDEMDKISKDDIASLHHGMEQQEIPVNKWGISATLKSRCNIMAAANPKGGRFDSFQAIDSQLSFDATILSRFDIIVLVRDIPNRETDGAIYSHMARTHCEADHNLDDLKPDNPDTEFLRKYIAHARTIMPRIPAEVFTMLRTFAVDVRMQSQMSDDTGQSSKLSCTHRMFACLMRITEASARLHLRDQATPDDARCAMERINTFLHTVARDSDGNMDIDAIESGQTGKVRDLGREIMQYIRINTLQAGPDGAGMYENKIVDHFVSKGETQLSVSHVLKDMMQSGELCKGTFNTINVVK